jgi:hypothetical protein
MKGEEESKSGFQPPKVRKGGAQEMLAGHRQDYEMQKYRSDLTGTPDGRETFEEVYITDSGKADDINSHKVAPKEEPKHRDWFFDGLAEAFGFQDEDPALTEQLSKVPKSAPPRDWFFDGLAETFGMNKKSSS